MPQMLPNLQGEILFIPFVLFLWVYPPVFHLTLLTVALQPVTGEPRAIELPVLEDSPAMGTTLALFGKEVIWHIFLVLSYP